MALKKTKEWTLKERKKWIDPNDHNLTITEQLKLSDIAKSTYYYETVPESKENLSIMESIDKIYTKCLYYGSRKVVIELEKIGIFENRKRVSFLMKKMGIEAQYQKPNLSKVNKAHKKHLYLLKNFILSAPNQVWSTDIIYIPLKNGFLYLVAIIDWYSRYVISWRLANIFIERFWRALKYEDVYLKRYETGEEAWRGIGQYMEFYNNERIHQALQYKTPAEIHVAA